MVEELVKDIIFIDIETVACVQDFSYLHSEMQNLWREKVRNLIKTDDFECEKFFRDRGAIYSEFGKVIVIVIGSIKRNSTGVFELRTKAFFGDNERDILREFKGVVEKFDRREIIFCGHNIKEFDIPYICRRMVVNSIGLPECLNLSAKKPWEVKHLDTMEMWSYGDRKNYTSLHLLSTILGIESSKNFMDGGSVHEKYYDEKNFDDIVFYCREDVRVVAQLFLKMKNVEPFDKKNVIFL